MSGSRPSSRQSPRFRRNITPQKTPTKSRSLNFDFFSKGNGSGRKRKHPDDHEDRSPDAGSRQNPDGSPISSTPRKSRKQATPQKIILTPDFCDDQIEESEENQICIDKQKLSDSEKNLNVPKHNEKSITKDSLVLSSEALDENEKEAGCSKNIKQKREPKNNINDLINSTEKTPDKAKRNCYEANSASTSRVLRSSEKRPQGRQLRFVEEKTPTKKKAKRTNKGGTSVEKSSLSEQIDIEDGCLDTLKMLTAQLVSLNENSETASGKRLKSPRGKKKEAKGKRDGKSTVKSSAKQKVTDSPGSVCSDSDENPLSIMVDGPGFGLDKMLEESAAKSNLSAINVKNILHHVITNQHVLDMVKNSLQEAEQCQAEEPISFEPKMTRTKVKQIMEKEGNVPHPWPMSPLKKPAKPVRNFLDLSFAEDEDDDDFDPSKEEVEHEDSDADSESVVSSQFSDFGSPRSAPPMSPFTPSKSTCFDEESDTGQNQEKHITALAVPMGPPLPPSAKKRAQEEAETIAYRTRSKLPLEETPLEEIESTFVAPDVTFDMYDTECEDKDWWEFLWGLKKTPAEEAPPDVVAQEEIEDDPEYNFLAEEEEIDVEDYRFDKAVKVSKKELNELMDEWIEAYGDLIEDDWEIEGAVFQQGQAQVTRETVATLTKQKKDLTRSDAEEEVPEITSEQRLQIDDQMRKHVQLLTQVYTLSLRQPELEATTSQCSKFLHELSAFSQRLASDKVSAFSAINLTPALEVINTYNAHNPDSLTEPLPVSGNAGQKKIGKNGQELSLSFKIQDILANCKALLYTDLLPECAFMNPAEVGRNKKIVFTASEDNLLALGLVQFGHMTKYTSFLRQYLLPPKTESQLAIHIKNLRAKKAKDNPVRFLKAHKILPDFPRYLTVITDIKAPIEHEREDLPDWLLTYKATLHASSQISGDVSRPSTPGSSSVSTPEKNSSQVTPSGKGKKKRKGRAKKQNKTNMVVHELSDSDNNIELVNQKLSNSGNAKGKSRKQKFDTRTYSSSVNTVSSTSHMENSPKAFSVLPTVPSISPARIITLPLSSTGTVVSGVNQVTNTFVDFTSIATTIVPSSSLSGNIIYVGGSVGDGTSAGMQSVMAAVGGAMSFQSNQPAVSHSMPSLASLGIQSSNFVNISQSNMGARTSMQGLSGATCQSSSTATKTITNASSCLGLSALQASVQSPIVMTTISTNEENKQNSKPEEVRHLRSSGQQSEARSDTTRSGHGSNSSTPSKKVRRSLSGQLSQIKSVQGNQKQCESMDATVSENYMHVSNDGNGETATVGMNTGDKYDEPVTVAIPMEADSCRATDDVVKDVVAPTSLPDLVSPEKDTASPQYVVLVAQSDKTPSKQRPIRPKPLSVSPKKPPVSPFLKKVRSPRRRLLQKQARAILPNGILVTTMMSPTKKMASSICARARRRTSQKWNQRKPIVRAKRPRKKSLPPSPDVNVDTDAESGGVPSQETDFTSDYDTVDSDVISDSESAFDPAGKRSVEEIMQKSRPRMQWFEDAKAESDDDQQADDLDALMAASSTIRYAPSSKARDKHLKSKKKKKKQLAMAMMAPDIIESDPLRDERDTTFAQAYLTRVQSLVSPECYRSFLKVLSDFTASGRSPVELQREIKVLFFDFPELVDDFASFLLPQQAVECHCLVPNLQFTKARTFLRKVEVYYGKHPSYFRKILKAFTTWQSNPLKTYDMLRKSIVPLLRGQPHLEQEFSATFPDEKPPERSLSDYEELSLSEEEGKVDDGYETIKLPEEENYCGTVWCVCECHDTANARYLQRKRHCKRCRLKIIAGRIYIQSTDKNLRPAQVVYPHGAPESLILSSPENHNDYDMESDPEVTEAFEKESNRLTFQITDDQPLSSGQFVALDQVARDSPAIPEVSLETGLERPSKPPDYERVLGTVGQISQEKNVPGQPASHGLEDQSTFGYASDAQTLVETPGGKDTILSNDNDPLMPSSFTHVHKDGQVPLGETPGGTDINLSTDNDPLMGSSFTPVHKEAQVPHGGKDSVSSFSLTASHTETSSGSKRFEMGSLDGGQSSPVNPSVGSGSSSHMETTGGGNDLKPNSFSADVAASMFSSDSQSALLEFPWTKDEDKLILEKCKTSGPRHDTFQEIASTMHHRSTQQVSDRFQSLMKLFSQVEDDSSESGSESESMTNH